MNRSEAATLHLLPADRSNSSGGQRCSVPTDREKLHADADPEIHERLNPPLRPPLPNLTLGGMNFNVDIVLVRSSTAASWNSRGSMESLACSSDVWFCAVLLEIIGESGRLLPKSSSEASRDPEQLTGFWSRAEALAAAELSLRWRDRSMELRLSIPELTMKKS